MSFLAALPVEQKRADQNTPFRADKKNPGLLSRRGEYWNRSPYGNDPDTDESFKRYWKEHSGGFLNMDYSGDDFSCIFLKPVWLFIMKYDTFLAKQCL